MTRMCTRIHTPGPAAQLAAITRHAARDRLPLAAVVSVIVAGLSIVTGSLWPPLRRTFADLPASVNDTLNTVLAGADLTTPAGWMSAEVLSLVAPFGIIAVAVISITRAIPGEEQDKTLGMLLSLPVSRITFLLAKTTAMMAHVLIVVAGLATGLVVASQVGDLGLAARGILGACVHLASLGLFFGGLAALVGAVTGDRRISAAVSAGVAGLAFALNAFLPLSDALANGARISPWYYFAASDPLVTGADVTDVTVLAAGALVLTAAAVGGLSRRDLRG